MADSKTFTVVKGPNSSYIVTPQLRVNVGTSVMNAITPTIPLSPHPRVAANAATAATIYSNSIVINTCSIYRNSLCSNIPRSLHAYTLYSIFFINYT